MSAVDALLEMVDDQPSAASLPKSAASLPNSVDALFDMIDERRVSIGSKSFRPRSPSVGPVPFKKIRRKQGPKRKLRREQEEVEEPEEEAPPSRVNFDAIGRSSMTS